MIKTAEEIKILPTNWIWTHISELGQVVSGGTPSTKVIEYWGGDIPWVSPADLSKYSDKYISRGKKSLTQLGLNKSSARLMPTGSILLSSRAPIGYVVISTNPISTNQGFKNLVPSKYIFNEYIYYYLKSSKQLLEDYASGTTFKELSSKGFARIPVPLPPFNEQHHIVNKIEELFSELDAGVESLKTAQAQLKRYRQSVLKSAFEGKLTAEWREQQQEEGNLESAKELLQKIQEERQNRYQKELDAWEKEVQLWEENGKLGKKPKKPQKPKELSPLTEAELAELPELPKGWFWKKVGYLTLRVEYGTATKSEDSGKIPVLRMGNIQNGFLDWSDLVYTNNDEEINKYYLSSGDVLFNRTNSPEWVGKTALYLGKQPAIFAGYLIRINQIPTIVNARYLNYFLNSIFAKKHSNKVKTDGVNQSNINGTKLINYPFPYCSLEEQNKIVEEIESRFSICDQLEATITENLQKSEALRQSILKQAFSGKLVPQNPNDEPASVLLERIKQEKENAQNLTQTSLNI